MLHTYHFFNLIHSGGSDVANVNDCRKGVSLIQVISGVSIIVVATLIIWLCSSVQSHETRITLSEDRYGRIQNDLREIKNTIEKSYNEQTQILYAIRHDQKLRANKTERLE